MAMDPEALYRQLGELAATVPKDLGGPDPISTDMHRWLGRAAALIDELGDIYDIASFRTSTEGLNSLYSANHAHTIVTILHRALARAELKAPASARGAFIAAGAAFDVFQVVGKVLQEAVRDVLIVDAYMDSKVLTDFAPLAPEGISIRLLTDSFYTKPEMMRPPVERWAKQYGTRRALEVRLTAPRLLHDRLIDVDGGRRVWSLTQSLKDFAGRSPGSVMRVDEDLAKQKQHTYGKMWEAATPL
jgi:hypothetical protein